MNANIISILPNDVNTLVIPIYQKEHTQVIKHVANFCHVSVQLIEQDFTAKSKETLILYTKEKENIQRIILLGLGNDLSFKMLQNTFRSFLFTHKNSLNEHLIFSLDRQSERFNLKAEMILTFVETLSAAWLLASYDLGQLKQQRDENDSKFPKKLDIFVANEDVAKAQTSCERASIIAQAQLTVMELIDLPANKINALTIAEHAQKSGDEYNYSVHVLNKTQIEEHHLHALLAVNQGSETPPTFIISEYKNTSTTSKLPVIGLVGKGVTYDTGGLSMKTSAGMYLMKCDMGGGAVVLGVVEAIARLKLPVHIIGIVPATDNNVDAKSMRPGDVINSHAALSIEVVDTDAEGRLILADGVSYLTKTYNPDVLIDIATLTGSSIISLGYEAGALCSNNDELAQQLVEAGTTTNERVWRLPIWDEYRKMLNSDVADIKNFPNVPVAGAVVAAKFIEAFTHKHPKWAHLDIAGMAFGSSEYAKGKSATGYGVRLLVEYISSLTQK